MKYFERFLVRPGRNSEEGGTDSAITNDDDVLDDVDIAVHCDISVFEWLVRCARAPFTRAEALSNFTVICA